MREIKGLLIAALVVMPIVFGIAMSAGITGFIPATILTILSGVISHYIYPTKKNK